MKTPKKHKSPGEKEASDIIVLRERGITGKGYGHVAKVIMNEWDIDLGSKSLYGYYCSATGSEGVFLRRARILSELGIGEATFKRQMANLEKHGIISRSQSRSENGAFSVTTVEMVMCPQKYAELIAAAKEAETKPTMYSGTIYALGYGTMPRLVARDARLSAKARGLYAYIVCYADINGEAFPSREKILRDLGIDKNSYSKYLKELITYGYLSVKQVKGPGGKMAGNIFTINTFPDEVQAQREEEMKLREAGPCPKNDTTVETAPCPKNDTTVETAPCPKNDTTVSAPCPNLPCPVQPCPSNDTTAYYNINTNQSINTISLIDRVIESVREKIHYNVLIFGYERDPMALDATDMLLEAIAKVMTTTNSRVQLGGEVLFTKNVCEVLLQVNNAAFMAVIERYLARTDTVSNPRSYLLKSLYNEILHPSTQMDDDVLEIF